VAPTGYAATVNEQSNFAGSPHYAAPEVHDALEPGTPPYICTAADVWSAGVCFFAMLATQLPFGGSEDTEEDLEVLREKIRAGRWDVQPDCSDDALDLVTRMLAVDADARMTLDDVCEHVWVGGADNVPWRGYDE
jgi:serine/threonine protein kinase